MHELSIASAMFEQMQRHRPAGAVVRKVRLRIGPMQGIEPDSLRYGWEAICREAGVEMPELILELPGWQLHCPKCDRRWESSQMYVECSCGCATPAVEGGAELQMISIDVEEPAKVEQP